MRLRWRGPLRSGGNMTRSPWDRYGCDPLTRVIDIAAMIDCEDMIERLHEDVRIQVHLAVLAEAVPVAVMHLALAELHQQQALVAEELCEDA
jgi:hypothetical protein